jgi:hypothetical protein
MSYGFQAINTSNTIQIDENYKNYQVYSYGSVNLNTLGAFLRYSHIFTAPLNSILLISDHNYTNTIISCYSIFGYGVTNFTVLSEDIITIDFVILVLGTDSLPSLSGYGLNVYNQSGEVVYTSNLKTPQFIATGAKGSPISLPSSSKRRYLEVSTLGKFGQVCYPIEGSGSDWFLWYSFDAFQMPNNNYIGTTEIEYFSGMNLVVDQGFFLGHKGTTRNIAEF